jgi:hypothetical protein
VGSFNLNPIKRHLQSLSNPLPTPFSTRMDEILEELRSLREIIKALHPASPPSTTKCEGVTGKGTQCRNRASPDSCYCRMHGERPPKPPRVVKAKKVAKPKKVQPEHTHGVGEACQLCATHGDVWDPGLTECRFIGQEINVDP